MGEEIRKHDLTYSEPKQYKILCGIEAHVCVQQTVLDETEHVIVVCDAVSSQR